MGEAVEIQRGYCIPSNSLEWSERDETVWLMVIDVEINGGRMVDGTEEPGPVEYSRVIIVMDAGTGDLISRSAYPVGHPVNDVSSTNLQEYVETPN